MIEHVQHLRVAFTPSGIRPKDSQLLNQFIATRDGAAFASLVHRHDPMVMGVCRRILGNHHDAGDAYRATFLLLALKATLVADRKSLGD